MNGFRFLVATGMLVSGLATAAEKGTWTTQSSEYQYDQQVKAQQKMTGGEQETNKQLRSSDSTEVNVTNLRALRSRPSKANLNEIFWVFDAWITLHQDRDYDGYYHHFSLELDADTEYLEAQVYARVYLGVNDVFNEYHVTDNFTIYADSSDDSYVIETELLSGFPSNDYEVLIEVYDAYNDELVAVYDGYDDADLYLLSLESKDYDQAQVVIVEEYGGSMGLWSMLLLPVLFFRRYAKATWINGVLGRLTR